MRCFASALLGVLMMAGGCGFLRIAREPMESKVFRDRGPTVARGVIVLLPGFGDRPSSYEEHGFVAAIAEAAPELDIVAADAHFGYYRKRSILVRLEQDVIGPLRARGYREIYLAGASMGGYGAVAYARTHPSLIRGVFLLAPYMGGGDIVKEAAAKGLCQYAPQIGDEDNVDNFSRKNFAWLKQQACDRHEVGIYLGVGDKDRLQRPDSVLGGVLPKSHFVVLPGGHGWVVWTPAIKQLLRVAFDSPEARY